LSEKTIYFKEANNLIVACYESQGFSADRARVWRYDVVVKGRSRAGHLIHYILSRNIYESYSVKKPHEVVMVLRHAIREARGCIDALITKVQNDSRLLKGIYDTINQDDIKHGK